MKVGISFLIVIALVLGSVSVVTVIKNREIHLSNLLRQKQCGFGIEKVQFNANRAAAFLKNLCTGWNRRRFFLKSYLRSSWFF